MEYKSLSANQIQLEGKLPKPKKITGTRFSSIVGFDKWNTPFKTWCAITKFYEEPFEDTVYTIAGKVIEPKVLAYLKKIFWSDDIILPTDIYGADPFKKTWGDFFKDEPIFGGMWDALIQKDGKTTAVIEVKTTKRIEDWENGVPHNYLLQGALYAHLLGVDKVVFVVCFLEDTDYAKPENFVPSPKNTKIISINVSDIDGFEGLITEAVKFWKDNVLTGISPEITDADKDLMKQIGKTNVTTDDGMDALLKEADELMAKLAVVAPLEKRLADIKKLIKTECEKGLTNGKTSAIVESAKTTWTLSVSETRSIDKELLTADGLLEKYEVVKTTTTLRSKERGGN
jgi:hypothetical protein